MIIKKHTIPLFNPHNSINIGRKLTYYALLESLKKCF